MVNGAQVGVPKAVFLLHKLDEVRAVQVVLAAAVVNPHQPAQVPVGVGVVVGAAPLGKRHPEVEE